MSRNLVLLAVLAGLAGCGTNPTDRALTGGAIGAGVGMLGAAATDSNIAAGALLGGLAGAAAGGLTDPETIDLGEPVYRRTY